jgi:hypothetical protein
MALVLGLVVLTAQYSMLWGSYTEHLSWERPSTGAALLAEFFASSRSEMFGG